MKFFQSERRLSRELARLLTSPQEKLLTLEQKVLIDDQDFLVFLDSDLEIEGGSLEHYQIRDGYEVVLKI